MNARQKKNPVGLRQILCLDCFVRVLRIELSSVGVVARCGFGYFFGRAT
jgi:hypothetical protein